MASLQDRLDKAFGALGGASKPAWQPNKQQIFRSGGVLEDGSSDEEYEERQRRESVPGLAQALVDEDEPDEEGFRPSTAFCRALDAEDEYNDIDEVATGLIERHRGSDALPPRETQVLEDNPYEERSRQWQATVAGSADAQEQPTGMEVEETGEPAEPAAGEQQAQEQQQEEQQQGTVPARSALPASGSGNLEGRQKKQVRFEGVGAPWVPPSRRPGYQPRCTELPPGEEEPAGQRRQQRGQRRGGGQPSSLSVVPEHVKHPEKFTCYVLEEPLVVGGGVGQLSTAGQQQDLPPAAARAEAASGEAGGQEAEPERWQGTAGKGVVQFKPKHKAAHAAGSDKAGSDGSAGQPAGPQLAFEDSAEGEAVEGGTADVAMQEQAQAPARPKRQYRSTRAADAHE